MKFQVAWVRTDLVDAIGMHFPRAEVSIDRSLGAGQFGIVLRVGSKRRQFGPWAAKRLAAIAVKLGLHPDAVVPA